MKARDLVVYPKCLEVFHPLSKSRLPFRGILALGARCALIEGIAWAASIAFLLVFGGQVWLFRRRGRLDRVGHRLSPHKSNWRITAVFRT